jgi:hypothetical protein
MSVPAITRNWTYRLSKGYSARQAQNVPGAFIKSSDRYGCSASRAFMMVDGP